jgi:hypothetical protein
MAQNSTLQILCSKRGECQNLLGGLRLYKKSKRFIVYRIFSVR